MTKAKHAMGLAVLLAGISLLVGCSPPIEESKPVQAGDGSQKPVAAGASGAGGGTAPTAASVGKGDGK